MARLSVQKAKAEKQLANIRGQLKRLDEDKVAPNPSHFPAAPSQCNTPLAGGALPRGIVPRGAASAGAGWPRGESQLGIYVS